MFKAEYGECWFKMYLTMIIFQLITIINIMVKMPFRISYQKPGKNKHNKLSIDWWGNFPKTILKSKYKYLKISESWKMLQRIMNCKKRESNGILDKLNYTAVSLMNGVP